MLYQAWLLSVMCFKTGGSMLKFVYRSEEDHKEVADEVSCWVMTIVSCHEYHHFFMKIKLFMHAPLENSSNVVGLCELVCKTIWKSENGECLENMLQ